MYLSIGICIVIYRVKFMIEFDFGKRYNCVIVDLCVEFLYGFFIYLFKFF